MAVSETAGFHDSVETNRESADRRIQRSERVSTRTEAAGPGAELRMSAFKMLKLEQEAQKNWDQFYKRNSTNFFKDRRWTSREFQELRARTEVSRPDWKLPSSNLPVVVVW